MSVQDSQQQQQQQTFTSAQVLTLSSKKTFDSAQVLKHSSKGDMWVTFEGSVLDVSKFVEVHPGGFDIINQFAGEVKEKVKRLKVEG